MKRQQAEEYSEALGQIGAGWWRQVAWADRQGIPEELGLSTKEWVQTYVGGHLRMKLEDRRAAVLELTEQGMSQRRIADVLGVGLGTVNRDVPNGTLPPAPEQEAVPNGTEEPNPAQEADPFGSDEPEIAQEELTERPEAVEDEQEADDPFAVPHKFEHDPVEAASRYGYQEWAKARITVEHVAPEKFWGYTLEHGKKSVPEVLEELRLMIARLQDLVASAPSSTFRRVK